MNAHPAPSQTPLTEPRAATAERELARLVVAQMQDVLLARFIGREEATRLGFAPPALTRIATAISEMARNVVQHAGRQGQIVLSEATRPGRRGLRIVVSDAGRGIEDLESVLQEGRQALGAGIPGTRRLMDEFQLDSRPGAGTTVTMTHWLPIDHA